MRTRSAETREELTARERQIAQLARDGHSNAEIGARLFLRPKIVEMHRSHAYRKLGMPRARDSLAPSTARKLQGHSAD